MTTKKWKRHGPEQIVRKLRDANAMLKAGKDLSAVLQSLEVSEATYARWRSQYGEMKAEETVRLKELEDEIRETQSRAPSPDNSSHIQMLSMHLDCSK
jgi:putative transposase